MNDTFWADEHLQFTDQINNEIWTESPGEQLAIQVPAALREPGSIGAQQAMLDEPPLPWVPDLIGQRWQDQDSIIIIGSACSTGTEIPRRAELFLGTVGIHGRGQPEKLVAVPGPPVSRSSVDGGIKRQRFRRK